MLSMTIPGYDITEVIHESLNTIVYQGVSQVAQEPVILKVLKAEYPTLEQITRLKHEYSITENLYNSGIVKVLRLENHSCRLVLVAEDFGGISLKKYLKDEKLSLHTFLNIALQIAKALRFLHSHNIIHKDIKPSNIIINSKTGVCKITDFSIASRLFKETPQPINATQLEGTLAYISPEQTGRMNRIVDYRSDFYSLGVTFYEVLTGQLPFESNDPLELIHCHLAKQPTLIQNLNTDIPFVIVGIVTKLMAKNTEDRYQSAVGLLADLETCLEDLKNTGNISEFIPGTSDQAAQLNIPQKLYGRDEEVATLIGAFDRVAGNSGKVEIYKQEKTQSIHVRSRSVPQESKIELMLVSGYSGIGKSCLVNEVHKPIVRQRGYFISGKFDQLGRCVPYASVIQAFKSLMRQLLTENSQQLQIWKEKLQDALGTNGQVIIDVIPEVEFIIGQQPELPELGATESFNRFNRVFQQFIQVFCQQEHPLVLFLDDLQWADSASLKLLQIIMTNPDSKYLLLIGAYRDNEVSLTHPLIKTVEEIEKAGTAINSIVLRPLEFTHIQQIVADTLIGNEELGIECGEKFNDQYLMSITQLAELLFNKTQGNPFFLTQLLKTLHQENLLKFDFTTRQSGVGRWQWNIQDILATGIADKSVVELLVGDIQKLPPSTQTVLKLAACIGARFSLDVLSIISEQSFLSAAEALQPALQQGLVLPLNKEYKVPLLFADEELNTFSFDDSKVAYRFLHDRVQQAGYSLIPEEEKKTTHLKIGKLLLKNTPSSEIESNIFDIVNQLNVGIDTLTQQKKLDELDELARLNLIAGRRANAAAAYEGAFNYLNIGLTLLPIDAWQTQYDLALALYESVAEAAYLTANFEQTEEWADIVLQQAKTILDKVKVYEVKIQTRIAQAKFLEAVKLGLQVLELLDVSLPFVPTHDDIQQALEETAACIHQKSISDLINLPLMTDAHQLAAMRILSSMVTPTFVAAPTLYLLTMLFQVKLSIKCGNAPFSTFAYASYGLILQGITQEIEAGYQFGNLAVSLMERLNAFELAAKIFLVVAISTTHIKEHVLQTLQLLQAAYSGGLENGDLEYAGLAVMYQCQYSYFVSQELASLDREMKTISHILTQFGQTNTLNYHENLRQVVLNLSGSTDEPCHLVGEVYNEEKMLPLYLESNDQSGLHFFYSHKLVLYYLFGEFAQAVANAESAARYLNAVTGLLYVPIFHFYDSLAQLAMYFDCDITQQQEILDKVEFNQEKMQFWAHYAPMNFQHKYDFVEAEKSKVLGHNYQAMDYYDKAIAGAAQNGYIQEESLANERAAIFYISIGKHKIAKTYITDAYYGYIKWGAIAKTRDLEKRYPNLIIRNINTNPIIEDKYKTIASTTISKTTGSTTSANQILDLTTVIKASAAITSEINLENLHLTLLHIILENAGAQKGCLILEKNNQFFVEAIDNSEHFNDIILQSIPVVECLDVCQKLINYVTQTQEALVIRDAQLDPICNKDSYIQEHQCKSILCAPIIYQTKLIGIFYLENNLVRSAFTPARLELIKILSSQAAIAIKNARLYAREQEKTQQLHFSLTKLQQTQAQLVHTEKISSLGQLVAGVAHEVNNPVSFINGNLAHAQQYTQDLINHLQLYQQQYPSPVPSIVEDAETIDLEFLCEDLPKMIDAMKLGTMRIKEIMQSLRNFSRNDGDAHREVDIHEGIETTLMILSHRIKAKPQRPTINIIKHYGKIPLIQCYPGQLNQVFMNLLANAIDALEESNQGKNYHQINNQITIRTACVDEWVTISITDNGLGMTQEVKEKLFDAFFTTKPEGQGTGLGLSISYQIVTEKHGGSLNCISSPGEGATFVIKIPRSIGVQPVLTTLRKE
jgi:predicted ATPase/signal transduction histidine kinase/tRNA A-37 threonylcarbamoyl transferase component Bud32